MTNKMTKLKEWGCDVDGALERLVGDVAFYEECLQVFTEDDNFASLGKALEEKEYDSAFEYAHTIKGVAANLGLTPVFDKASDIVEPLRAKDYSDLDVQYRAVCDAQKTFCDIMSASV
ncbi:MAG: Hpt domain-containing protein [Eubacteriaceae bacterium]|nr:Hpt domain-containing protein [Eubacteriaceae bacterium]